MCSEFLIFQISEEKTGALDCKLEIEIDVLHQQQWILTISEKIKFINNFSLFTEQCTGKWNSEEIMIIYIEITELGWNKTK